MQPLRRARLPRYWPRFGPANMPTVVRRRSTLAQSSLDSGSTMSQLELRPGLADVPVAESAISFIDGKRARLEYRGVAVETLARQRSHEETCWLLLNGDLPAHRELAGVDDALPHHRRLKYTVIDRLKSQPEPGRRMDGPP